MRASKRLKFLQRSEILAGLRRTPARPQGLQTRSSENLLMPRNTALSPSAHDKYLSFSILGTKPALPARDLKAEAPRRERQ